MTQNMQKENMQEQESVAMDVAQEQETVDYKSKYEELSGKVKDLETLKNNYEKKLHETNKESAQRRKALEQKAKEENDYGTQLKILQETLTEKETKIKQYEQKVFENDLFGKIRSTALQLNAIDGDIVVRLVKENFTREEDGRLVARNDDGSIAIDQRGNPLSVEAFVSRFLSDDKKKFLLKGSGITGTGQNPQKTITTNFSREAIADMSLADFEKNQTGIFESLKIRR